MIFRLPFPDSEIDHWEEVYKSKVDMCLEAAAFRAGELLSKGQGGPGDLITIGRWKSKRTVPLLEKNEAPEIVEACRIAAKTSNDACAVAVLQCLHGVAVPMASAILTFMHPRRYTVIDWRVLALFRHPRARKVLTIADYVPYVDGCRELAQAHGVTLRKLDQALWAKSKYPSQHPSRSRTRVRLS